MNVRRLLLRSSSSSNNVWRSSGDDSSKARSASSKTTTRSLLGTNSPSSISFPRYFGMTIATSVCCFNPNAASSSSKIHAIRTPFGPLYLNMLALPRISVGSFLIFPPISSYNVIAVWTPNSLVGTTISASGVLTSLLESFPNVDNAAPVAIAPARTGLRLLVRTTGEVTTDIRSTKSPDVSPTDSSAPTRRRCRRNNESLNVDNKGAKYEIVFPDPVEPLTTTPISFPF
mmetsp:Transcript_3181/g.7279  ORF Transcript_3181/g.7279 Transcript_3181/m.7279 type:complete len:230 (-) Transcript_3181:587-1276(-)